jgi:nucleotide-binding universal stress UspA family protein
MMSTHGHSGIKEWDDIGGVASKVLHASRVPVWLVPSGLREEIVSDTLPRRTIVIPLSGSKMSEAVIPHVLNIATQRGAETDMVLLSAIDPGVITVSREQLREREREYDRVKAYLDEVAQRIETAGFAARTEVLMGEPAEAIIGYLKANPPQLICMATRGKTGLSKFVFGSVTEHVIRLIKKTPMLLVSGAEQD